MSLDVAESLLRDHGYADFRWISGADVEVYQWPRFKCIYGCPTYGKKGTCPPAVPPVEECRAFFREYERVAVIHLAQRLDNPDDRGAWSRRTNLDLLKLERDAFLAGHHKAFLLFMDECRICEECAVDRADCKNPAQARPCPEALGVDLFATVRKVGYPLEVLSDVQQEMNRYALLMVE